jgi:hypothetical protein
MQERQAKEMSECTFAPKVKRKTAARPKAKHLGESLVLMPESVNTVPASEKKGDHAPQESLRNKLSAGELHGEATQTTEQERPHRLSAQQSAANPGYPGSRINSS